MIIFIYIFCFFLVVFGLMNFFFPKKGKRIFHAMAYIMPFWAWGFISLLVFFFLWQSAPLFRFPLFIRIISMISLMEGLYLIFFPKRKIKKMIELWTNSSEMPVKIAGLAYFTLGIFIVLSLLK